MGGQFLSSFFYLEPKNGLSYHHLTLSVKGFAWQQSLYTRFHSGRQGFLLLK